MPQVISRAREIQAQATSLRLTGKRIGLVPTMGALHEGHLSLVRAAKRDCDLAIASIFVNPTQFAPHEDFTKYPRVIDADLALLETAGCDLVFAPPKDEIYPAGFSTCIEPPAVARMLEGQMRPEHFRGVCTVVLKLFNLVPCDVAYFGQKDYQQCLVVKHMARDLDLPLRIEVCPIVREADGLAMSSRNRYLSAGERLESLGLFRSLQAANDLYQRGERTADVLQTTMLQTLSDHQINQIDYAKVVDAETLEPLNQVDRPAVALIACRVGTTRLIDNQILTHDQALATK